MSKKTPPVLHEPTESLNPRDVDARLGEVLAFMRLLWAVDHGLQSTSKRMESALGVTGPQRLVVRIVGRYPGISAGQLADVLHIHPSTLTGVLKRLESRSLLERTVDPTDARRSLFGLSELGRQLDSQRAGTVEASVRRGLAKLTPRQLAAAQEALAMISLELDHDGEDKRTAKPPARPDNGTRRVK